ncbi:MAG: DUF4476 domain-containing protein [Deltaproteobacteria bacterium]|nr:DUF4476 domain-containing protein [Deltaproteobacteria bacterium]
MIARLLLLALLGVMTMQPPSAHAGEEDELLGSSRSTSDRAAEPASAVAVMTGQDPADAAEALVKKALDRVVGAELALARGETAATRKELETLRGELQDLLVALGQLRQDRDVRTWFEEGGYVITSRESRTSAPGDPSADSVGPMSEADLVALQRSIEGAPFNEGKLQLLQEGIAQHTLTGVQAEELLQLFSFSRDRVDVLVFLHPRLADGEDFARLLAALKFESDRQAVRDRLGLDS